LPLAVSGLIVGVGIYTWIRRSIRMWQRKRAWERNEELYLQEKAELTRELEYYKGMHEDVRAANHKMMHRQTAAERSILNLMEKARSFGLPAEFNEELTVMMDDVRKLSKEYQDAVDSGREAKKLPSTNIRAVDVLFGLFAERFARNDIDFNLKVNGSIVYMAENVIPQNKLETMIGDHLQDALTAVNASDGSIRSVLAMIGEADGCYEFSVQDSGVPFGADTLIRLGTERVTTHTETGGTGIGFMTTFETMRECNASLIIKENVPGSGFSKTVTIRFDGKELYIIDTYRPNEFPENDRYIVVGSK
jgi:signal transduction histidine kinase